MVNRQLQLAMNFILRIWHQIEFSILCDCFQPLSEEEILAEKTGTV